jgi:hypothetical protein
MSKSLGLISSSTNHASSGLIVIPSPAVCLATKTQFCLAEECKHGEMR